MSDRPNAVIAGSLAEIRFVKSRSVCVLCVEIPIEQSEDAIAKFGVPIPGREIPLALALLQASPGPAPAVDSGPSTAPSFPKDAVALPARDTVKSERAKAQFAALPPMKQDITRASMMVKDETFQRWLLGDRFDGHKALGDQLIFANYALMQRLIIVSKAEIGESRDVNERWHTLLTTYQRDTGQLAEIRS